MRIIRVGTALWPAAKELAWKVFCRFEAEQYGEEGTENFRVFLQDEMLEKMISLGNYVVFAAVDERENMVGIISLRKENHISLLFVDADYHRQGIGKALIQEAAKHVLRTTKHTTMTVNGAPYALEFYHKIGFLDLAPEQTTDGIIYTPMQLQLI